jgi:glycerophosphoryl diester phosphodiesterase
MGHAPENTIASFEKAIALGCDEVETDVWLRGEGFVVSHDRPLDGAVLSLDEVLDLCAGRVTVNIELKVDDASDARGAGARLARHLVGSRADAYISSFSLTALEGAREAAPELRLAYVISRPPELSSLIATARALRIAQLHVGSRALTRELVGAAHDARLGVYVWTVNDPDDIARFASWGVDGIVSDYPERIAAAISSRSVRIA